MTSTIKLELLSLSLLLTLLGTSSAQPLRQQPANRPEPKPPTLLRSKPVEEDPRDNALQKLLKARYNEAIAEVKCNYTMWLGGKASLDMIADVAHRLVESGLDLYEQPAERVTLLEQYVELMREIEKITQEKRDAWVASAAEFHRARYLRLDAEIQLLRSRREADRAKDK